MGGLLRHLLRMMDDHIGGWHGAVFEHFFVRTHKLLCFDEVNRLEGANVTTKVIFNPKKKVY